LPSAALGPERTDINSAPQSVIRYTIRAGRPGEGGESGLRSTRYFCFASAKLKSFSTSGQKAFPPRNRIQAQMPPAEQHTKPGPDRPPLPVELDLLPVRSFRYANSSSRRDESVSRCGTRQRCSGPHRLRSAPLNPCLDLLPESLADASAAIRWCTLASTAF